MDDRSSVFARLHELATNAPAKLIAHIFLARTFAFMQRGKKEQKSEREREDESTRVIPTNFHEIALTSFSRGHIAIATADLTAPAPSLLYGWLSNEFHRRGNEYCYW